MSNLLRSCLVLGALASLPAAQIDVTTKGAVPNDANDDRAAIQSAINAAAAGDVVYLPAGTYLINGSLQARTSVAIRGAGQGTTIVRYHSTSSFSMVTLDGASKVEISYLTLDAANSTVASYGISGSNGSGHNLHHLTIENFAATSGFGPMGVYFSGDSAYQHGVTDSVITDCAITNIGVGSTWGSGIRIIWGSSRNQVLRNAISATGRGGIFGSDGATDLIVRHNTVSGSGRRAEGLGIEMYGGCDRAIVEDNVVDHWISDDSSNYAVFRRNTVKDTSGVVKSMALELVGAHDCVFTDNLCDSGQQMGISMSNDPLKQYIYWGHNTVQNMVQWGAQIQGDANGARQVYFYKDSFLSTQNANAQAWYPSDDGHGFRFNSNCHGITLDSCTISANKSLGIEMSDTIDQLSFVNNTITNNGSDSTETTTATDLEWSGNTVSGNGYNRQLASRGFANKKPTAAFSCAASAAPGQSVAFTSTSSDPDGSIAHSLWDFGDGAPVTSTSPSHAFAAAGTYRVTLLVWDNGGRGAICEKTITIGSTTPPPGAGTGLSATYYDNQDFTGVTVSRVDATVDFNWGSGSPSAAIGPDSFSARWTGKVQPPISGAWTFSTVSDDGVRLWVNGQKLIDNWTDHAPTTNSGSITLTGGQLYDVKMEYYEHGGGAVARLLWAGPSTAQQVVPSSRLYPASGASATAGLAAADAPEADGGGSRCGIGSGIAVLLALAFTRRCRRASRR